MATECKRLHFETQINHKLWGIRLIYLCVKWYPCDSLVGDIICKQRELAVHCGWLKSSARHSSQKQWNSVKIHANKKVLANIYNVTWFFWCWRSNVYSMRKVLQRNGDWLRGCQISVDQIVNFNRCRPKSRVEQVTNNCEKRKKNNELTIQYYNEQRASTYRLRSMMLSSMSSALVASSDTFRIIYGFSPTQLRPNLAPFYSHQFQLPLIVLREKKIFIFYFIFFKWKSDFELSHVTFAYICAQH